MPAEKHELPAYPGHRSEPASGGSRAPGRTASCFLDTNVLVYAVSSAPEEAAKKRVALELIASADFGLSAQVLQELYVTVTRKAERPLPVEQALNLLNDLRRFPFVETDWALVLAAIETSLRFRITYWDAAIVAASARLGATTLYTEDLNHGQLYGDVRALNPFITDILSPQVHDAAGQPYDQAE